MNRKLSETISMVDHILVTEETIRQTAQKFGIPKSTVYSRISKYLEADCMEDTRAFIKDIFEKHNQERHTKGGQSTKAKYRALKGE